MPKYITKIKQIVKQNIGLDSKTIGDNTLEKIIDRRIMKSHASDYKSYYNLLRIDANELNELLEIAVIPETWFFRDIRPFENIYDKAKKLISLNKKIKILSLPCSTGEEPYSLAMYLIGKGISDLSFSIEAVDISKRALEIAKEGTYGKNSFRGKHYQPYQQSHFTYQNEMYSINENIKKCVSFSTLNILHNNNALHNRFDFILCRNLLIYFDEETKQIAFKQLSAFLKEKGHLYIGHSEFGTIPRDILKNTGVENAFGLIKSTHPDFTEKKKPQSALNISVPKTKLPRLLKPKQIKVIKPEKITNKKTITLKQIHKLADSKQFEEAQSLCLQYIDENSESADSLYLLALISNSLGNEDLSISLFRKAIFLNPKHYDSLVHLSLILEKNGDIKSSKLLKKRADKALIEKKNNE